MGQEICSPGRNRKGTTDLVLTAGSPATLRKCLLIDIGISDIVKESDGLAAMQGKPARGMPSREVLLHQGVPSLLILRDGRRETDFMTDVNCPMCGFRVDLANESQPVCPCCGTDPFESDDDVYFEWRAEEADSFESTPSQRSGVSVDLPALLDKYAKNRAGIGGEPSLQDLCLDCRSSSVGKEGGRRQCRNPQCRAKWYVAQCWKCHAGIDSRDSAASRCHRCRWQKCRKCGACDENCREWQQTAS